MDRIKELISKMTLEEKASLCSGADNWHTKEIKRLNIPSQYPLLFYDLFPYQI